MWYWNCRRNWKSLKDVISGQCWALIRARRNVPYQWHIPILLEGVIGRNHVVRVLFGRGTLCNMVRVPCQTKQKQNFRAWIASWEKVLDKKSSDERLMAQMAKNIYVSNSMILS
jgi:hypothetical protein